MEIIKRLNDLRLQRNMSVYRLAELSGINQSTLANTFSRGTVPSVQNLEKICEALGITLAQFFSEESQSRMLTAEESEFIDNFRKLRPEIKENISSLVESMSKNV